MCVYMHVCLHVYLHLYVCVHVCAVKTKAMEMGRVESRVPWMCVHVYVGSVCLYVHVCSYMCNVCVRMYLHLCLCVCACMHVC